MSAKDHIMPLDTLFLEQESIVGLSSFLFIALFLLLCEGEGCSIVAWRASLFEGNRAFARQFLLGFIAWVEASLLGELLERALIEVKALGLVDDMMPLDTEPLEVFHERIGIALLATCFIGVIDTQAQRPAVFYGVACVEEGDTGVANMEESRRAWGKAHMRPMGGGGCHQVGWWGMGCFVGGSASSWESIG